MKGISLKPFRTKLIILNPSPAYFSRLKNIRNHCWASASRQMSSAYAFWNPVSKSGTGLGHLFSVLDWFRQWNFHLVQDWLDGRESGILKTLHRWKEIYTPCTSILLVVDRDTSCTSILLAVEMDTRFMSVLLAVESGTPCMSINGCWWCYSWYMRLKNQK